MTEKDDVRLTGIEVVTPYALMTTNDMYQVPPPEMLIEGVIPKQSINGITSYPGVGKTWFALEMARALASGDPFLGKFKIEKPSSVLFVGSDASVFDYAEQWRRLSKDTWSKYIPSEEDTQKEDFVEPVNMIEQNARFLVQSDFLFENMDSIRRLIRTCQTHEVGLPYWVQTGPEAGEGDFVQDHGFQLIVFDTLSKLTRANQNDNTEMEEVFRNIRLITETTGAAVLLLHHNSKRTEFNNGDDWRGAMAQIGALDGWLNVSKPFKDKSKVKVEVKKFRGRQPKPFTYKMDVDGEVTASLQWVAVEDEKTQVSEEARIVPAGDTEVKVESVPAFIRHMLLGGSKTRQELIEASLLKFDTDPPEDVTNRVSVALTRMVQGKEIMRSRKKGAERTYTLVFVDSGAAAEPPHLGGGAPGREQEGDIYKGEPPVKNPVES